MGKKKDKSRTDMKELSGKGPKESNDQLGENTYGEFKNSTKKGK